MAERLWDKGGAADAEMLRYTARDDWRLDQRLLAHDLRATVAHVNGLGRVGILSTAEVALLASELAALAERERTGAFVLTDADEDGHTAIEAALTATLGDVGKKVHTGRSRNDQVLVATRLWERDALDALAAAVRDGARTLCQLARREERTPMPGYTHLQRAVPSSIGFWAASFAEGFCDALDSIAAARALVDRCPLGTAAGYGVNLPLDREGVAAELGFAAVALNGMAAQTSRGIVEAQALGAAWHVSALARRLAWDLSLFAMAELGFVKLDEAFTTGSSIMPQKRNPDVVELMRASCSVVQGALAEVQSIVALPSAYHRDQQLTKGPTMRGLDEALATARLVPRLVGSLTFDKQRMADAISAECYATDKAVELAVAGVPFREAYKRVAGEIASLERGDAQASLAARTSVGAPGNLALDAIAARIEAKR